MKNSIRKLSTILLLLLVTGCSLTTNNVSTKNSQKTQEYNLSTNKADLVTNDF